MIAYSFCFSQSELGYEVRGACFDERVQAKTNSVEKKEICYPWFFVLSSSVNVASKRRGDQWSSRYTRQSLVVSLCVVF